MGRNNLFHTVIYAPSNAWFPALDEKGFASIFTGQVDVKGLPWVPDDVRNALQEQSVLPSREEFGDVRVYTTHPRNRGDICQMVVDALHTANVRFWISEAEEVRFNLRNPGRPINILLPYYIEKALRGELVHKKRYVGEYHEIGSTHFMVEPEILNIDSSGDVHISQKCKAGIQVFADNFFLDDLVYGRMVLGSGLYQGFEGNYYIPKDLPLRAHDCMVDRVSQRLKRWRGYEQPNDKPVIIC